MVSVVIPSYNREATIVRAVESVLSQTYKDIEVIVVDDGSIDATKDKLAALKDDRLIYIYQDNQGACAARNNGIMHAKGEHIAFHDSDDVCRKDRIERQLKALEENDADVVFCRLNRYLNDRLVNIIPTKEREGFLDKKDADLFGIGTQVLLGKASVFKENMFNKDMPRLQDMELLVRLIQCCRVYAMSTALVDYYLQDDSISKNKGKMLAAVENMFALHGEYLKINRSFAHDLIYAYVREINEAYAEQPTKEYREKLLWAFRKDDNNGNRVRSLLVRTGLYRAYLNKK